LHHLPSFIMPLNGDYNLDEIDRDYHGYNRAHPCLIRLNDASFLVRFPGSWHPGVIAAKQVQIYAAHNMRLFDASLDVRATPWGYRDFAMLMNQHDNSGFGWAFYSPLERRVKYPENLEPATVAEFMVHDDDIDGREVVRRGNVQVSAAWYQHAIEAEQRRVVAREKNIRNNQAAKRNLYGIPDIASPAKKAALARKIAEQEDEYQAAMARQRALNTRPKGGALAPAPAPVAPAPIAGPSATVGTNSTSNESTLVAQSVIGQPAVQPSYIPLPMSTLTSPSAVSSFVGSPHATIPPSSPAFSTVSMSFDQNNLATTDHTLLAGGEDPYAYFSTEDGEINQDALGEDEPMVEVENNTQNL
jgi:hypothetical protein